MPLRRAGTANKPWKTTLSSDTAVQSALGWGPLAAAAHRRAVPTVFPAEVSARYRLWLHSFVQPRRGTNVEAFRCPSIGAETGKRLEPRTPRVTDRANFHNERKSIAEARDILGDFGAKTESSYRRLFQPD